MHRRIEEASIAPTGSARFLSLVIGRACRRAQCNWRRVSSKKIVGFVQKICLKNLLSFQFAFLSIKPPQPIAEPVADGPGFAVAIDRDVVKGGAGGGVARHTVRALARLSLVSPGLARRMLPGAPQRHLASASRKQPAARGFG